MTTARPAPTQALIDGYEAAFAAVARVRAAPPADPAATARAAPLLAAEARLLDARAWDAWLALWAPAGAFWLPVHPADHPGRDQALAWDDLRRLTERARHMEDPQAWGTAGPAPMTTRLLGPVEAWEEEGGLLATAPLAVRHVRRRTAVTLTGREVLRIDRAGRIAFKALLFPDLTLAHPAMGWLM